MASSTLSIKNTTFEQRTAGLADLRSTSSLSFTKNFADTDVDAVWTSTAEIAAGANLDIDLTDLTDIEGVAFAFDVVKKLVVVSRGDLVDGEYVVASGEDLLIGNAASNAWVGPFSAGGNTHQVRCGGIYAAFDPLDGFAVTSSSKVLRIHNSGSDPNTIQIVIEGIKA